MNRIARQGGWLVLAISLAVVAAKEPGVTGAAEAPPTTKTAAGFPEVIIKGKSTNQIQAATSKFFIGRGYSEKISPNGDLTYQKPYSNPGSDPGSHQCLRIRVKIGKTENNAIKIMSRSYGVNDCGEATEKEFPTPEAYPQIQAFLDQIKKALGSK